MIEGDDVEVVDWNGKPYPIERRPVALCRCGASTTKPFCDGSHSRVGFEPDKDGVIIREPGRDVARSGSDTD